MSTVPNDYRKHILKSILEIFMKTKQILGHKVRLNKILKDKYHMDYMLGPGALVLSWALDPGCFQDSSDDLGPNIKP